MDRPHIIAKISQAFSIHPAVALLGPRQCGKTTISRQFGEIIKSQKNIHYFDLEDPDDLDVMQHPKAVLQDLEGLIIIDEIQRLPELFPLLRVLIDRKHKKQQFLILGSASRDLIKQSSESLAGRIEYLELTPFDYRETEHLDDLWVRGGFPVSFLAQSIKESYQWRKQYIRTFLERDIPQLGINIPAQNLRRFWMMLAQNHGNVMNYSEIGRSLALSHNTIRHYTDLLSGTFMIRQLQPWFENISKRQVKSPKVYFRDSGILHSLLAIENKTQLTRHIKCGASWEGFAIEEIIRHHAFPQEECYFWGTHQNAEIDLLSMTASKRIGFEIKFTDKPSPTKSVHIALEDLKLDKVIIIYPGKKHYHYSDKIEICGLEYYLGMECV